MQTAADTPPEQALVTLRIKKSTQRKLAKFGNKLSSWDSILKELMDHADFCDRFWESRN